MTSKLENMYREFEDAAHARGLRPWTGGNSPHVVDIGLTEKNIAVRMNVLKLAVCSATGFKHIGRELVYVVTEDFQKFEVETVAQFFAWLDKRNAPS